MWKRISMIGVGLLLAAAALVPLSNGLPDAQAAMTAPNSAGAPPPRQNPYSDTWLAANHGKFDNIWTAEYESRLQAGAGGKATDPFKGLLSPLYGPDVRMSNGSLLGSGQNEFQIDINPANSLNAIGTSNDGGAAGVGIFRTTDGGLTWSSRDASVYGVPAACCDPGVAFGTDGKVYAIILDTSPSVSYIIRSTDGGATWAGPSQVATPDRENIAVDPNNSNNVYVTYSELPGSNRIKGYKSTDGGVTFGPTFFVGDVAPAQGYEQSSQPRVASDGTLYVGYQQYTNSSVGCSAGVQNVLAKSTNGGVSFTYTVLPIVQGGACSSAQAGRGIFCINSGGSSFRSRSHPIIGVNPTNPNHVYMVYSGGDLETPYTCAGATGFHSDTLFRISTDGGATFSPPTKVNTDPSGKDQYYPWMSVTASGQIWIGWNDRREDTNDFLSRWYQSYSNDEGATFRKVDGNPGNDPVADVQTQPSSFIGDYHGLGAVNGNVLGMWFDSRISSGGDAFTDPQVPPAVGTPTATPTGVLPTATQTRTPTLTPSVTPTSCGGNAPYTIITGTGVLVPGTSDTGNHIDDGTTTISLPFPVQLYDQTYTSAQVGSNGTLAFGTSNNAFTNACLPDATQTYQINPYWDDQETVANLPGCSAFTSGCGIFTSTVGSTLYIEYRTVLFANTSQAENYEVVLTAGSPNFRIVYGTPFNDTASETVGVQKDSTNFTQYTCNSGNPPITAGLQLSFTLPACGTATVTPVANTPTLTATAPAITPTVTRTSIVPTTTPSVVPTSTIPANTPTNVPSTVPTSTIPANTATATAPPANTATPTTPPVNTTTPTILPVSTATATAPPAATATATACTINFSDVHMSDYFYTPVQYLYCHGVISGYSDGTFRPYNNTTRSQMVKIVVLGFNKAITTPTGGAYTFTDVTPANPFFSVIETAAADGIVSGYNCGTAPAGPCDAQHRPYFLPYNYVTRGQLAKIDVIAAGWALFNPATPSFSDVPRGSTFYTVIETAHCHGVVDGYSDGTFRPYNNATRGQISKIVYLSITNPALNCGP